MQNPKTEKEQIAFEDVPAIDDDADPGPTTAERQEDEVVGDESAPSRSRGDPKRDAIAQRYREMQADERGEAPPDEAGATDDTEGRASPGLPVSEPVDDPELTLVVYGNRLKRKRSELIEAYDLAGLDNERIIKVAQKEMAADQRLHEAKEAADQRLTGSPALPGASEGDGVPPADQSAAPRPDDADGLTPERPPRRPDQAFNEEKLDDIVQRVQFGDADEAKQALRDLAEGIKASMPSANPEEVLAEIDRRGARRQHQTEIYNSLTRFGNENPDLIADPHLFTVGLDIAKEEMLADLKAVGLTDEQLNPIAHDRQAVATAHKDIRDRGLSVRTVDEVLTAAADKLRTKFRIPKPQGERTGSQPNPANSNPEPARERLHRKELAPQQPRHGGVRAAPAQASRPKTAREIINEKRTAGGFRPV